MIDVRIADPLQTLFAGMSPQRIRQLLTDADSARAWVRMMALNGHAEAQLCYGRMLLEGKGAQKDPAAAFKWFLRAAEKGHVEAINMVGRCYDMGWGTPKNPEVAAKYFQRAASRVGLTSLPRSGWRT